MKSVLQAEENRRIS